MENNIFNYPKSQRVHGQIQTSVLISQEFYKLCKERNIKLSEALRVGVALMLAECGNIEYDNNLNISRKIVLLRENLEKVSTELNNLKERKDGFIKV